MMWLASTAAAQTGRVQGVVRDVNGRPIKGATVRALHADASPRELTSTTDDKGRFVMLGLRIATTWHFVAEAPGYFGSEGDAPVRSTFGAPLDFTLRRDPGPIPGALAKDIQEQLTAANALRDDGRYDQAIAAYQSIQVKNPKLTSLNLVLASTYRQKAGREADPATRAALLQKALSAYEDLLKEDDANERARTELAAVTADLQQLKKN
jgi:tetratricopeptide (TPR) repeat protein